MYREPVGDALYAAEAVVDKASDSCESNAAIRSFAPPIFLSLLPPRRFWRHPRKKETDVNCSADSSCRTNICLPRWGNVLPVFTRCSSPLSRMLQTRLSISWKMRLLPCLVHGFCRQYQPPCQHCAIAAVHFTMDLETVADSISNAFVGVVEATDVRWASLLLAPTGCGLTKWFDIASDEEDPISQSLLIISSSRISPKKVNSAEETFSLDSSLIDCLATELLDTPRDAYANVDPNAVSCPSIPGFPLDNTSHASKCTDLTEASDDYDTLLTHPIHSVTCFIDEEIRDVELVMINEAS